MIAELTERERIILDRLSADGTVSVSVLARELELSEVTIRGDFKLLEEKGWINRKRGGAAPALHRDILERQRVHLEQKNAIARAAAELVRDGDVIHAFISPAQIKEARQHCEQFLQEIVKESEKFKINIR